MVLVFKLMLYFNYMKIRNVALQIAKIVFRILI